VKGRKKAQEAQKGGVKRFVIGTPFCVFCASSRPFFTLVGRPISKEFDIMRAACHSAWDCAAVGFAIRSR
jgi:hypothetical protein